MGLKEFRITPHQWERLWLWFFPRRCVGCGGVTGPQYALCTGCEEKAAEYRIARGERLPGSTQIPLISCFEYRSPAKKIMLAMKFNGQRGYAPSIGYTMAEALNEAGLADKDWLFCCVPMTPARVKERGYNQAELLVKSAARWCNAAYDNALLRKLHETDTQHKLPAAQREQNVAGAFEAARPEKITGKRIVLCDDICTTGATLRACVAALQAAGAGEVLCLTFLQARRCGA